MPGTEYLKKSYKWPLRSIFVANVAAFWVVIIWRQELLETWALLESISLSDGILGLLFSVGAFVLDGLLSADAKTRVVYWRWRNPLPGSRAFSTHLPAERRADRDRLVADWGDLPDTPEGENRLWYRIYRTVEDEIRVQEAHRAWLFSRDIAGYSALFAGLFGSAALFSDASPIIVGPYLVALASQYGVAALAAQNYGVRFVRTVLAIASTGRNRYNETTNPV